MDTTPSVRRGANSCRPTISASVENDNCSGVERAFSAIAYVEAIGPILAPTSAPSGRARRSQLNGNVGIIWDLSPLPSTSAGRECGAGRGAPSEDGILVYRGDVCLRHVAGALHGPLIVLVL